MGLDEDQIARIDRDQRIMEKRRQQEEEAHRQARSDTIRRCHRHGIEFAQLMHVNGVLPAHDFMLEYPPALLWSPVRRWRGERNTVRVCGVWIMRPELGNGRMFRPGVLVSDSGEVLPYLTLPRTRAWNRGDVDFGDLQEPEGPPQFGVSLPFPVKRAMPAEAFIADLQEWPHSQIPTDDDWQRAAATHLRQVL